MQYIPASIDLQLGEKLGENVPSGHVQHSVVHPPEYWPAGHTIGQDDVCKVLLPKQPAKRLIYVISD